jgi:hypothetical protein
LRSSRSFLDPYAFNHAEHGIAGNQVGRQQIKRSGRAMVNISISRLSAGGADGEVLLGTRVLVGFGQRAR